MLKPVAFAVALIAAGPAAALSCLRPDIAVSFQTADDRPEPFVVALGALTRVGENVPDGPDTGDPNNRVGYSFAARFDGHFAGAQGFDAPQSVDVTVEVQCLIAWCGSDSLSDHALYFLRRDGADSYTLEAGPCQTYVFDNPVEHQLMEVVALMP